MEKEIGLLGLEKKLPGRVSEYWEGKVLFVGTDGEVSQEGDVRERLSTGLEKREVMTVVDTLEGKEGNLATKSKLVIPTESEEDIEQPKASEVLIDSGLKVLEKGTEDIEYCWDKVLVKGTDEDDSWEGELAVSRSVESSEGKERELFVKLKLDFPAEPEEDREQPKPAEGLIDSEIVEVVDMETEETNGPLNEETEVMQELFCEDTVVMIEGVVLAGTEWKLMLVFPF